METELARGPSPSSPERSGNLGPVWIAALARRGSDGRRHRRRAAPRRCVESPTSTDRAALETARDRIAADARRADVLVNNAGIDQPPDAAARPGAETRSTTSAARSTSTWPARSSPPRSSARRWPRRGAARSSTSARSTPASRPTRASTTTWTRPAFLKPPAYGASKAGVVQPDALLRPAVGTARRARQRAVARRGARRRRTTSSCASTARACRSAAWPSRPTSPGRCCSSPPTPRAT